MKRSDSDDGKLGTAAATAPGISITRLPDGRFAAVRRDAGEGGAVGPPVILATGTEAEAEQAGRVEADRGRPVGRVKVARSKVHAGPRYTTPDGDRRRGRAPGGEAWSD